jgi:uncharacterized protein
MSEKKETLAEKLRSLGVSRGSEIIPPLPKQKLRIEDVVEGSFIQSDFGEIFCGRTNSHNGYTHGLFTLIPSSLSPLFAKIAGLNSPICPITPSNIIFLDTETTGLEGGTGTIPFMVGLGWFSETGFNTYQLFLRDPSEETALLAVLTNLLSNARVIVTYNGKSFDVPILQTRFVMNGHPSPLSNMAHIDLLHISRRMWRRRLTSRTLKDIETEILHFSRSSQEVPGWEVPILYFDYLRTQNPAPLAGVFYHNAIDIISLAALFNLFNQDLFTNLQSPNEHPVDFLSKAIILDDLGEIDHAAHAYQKLISMSLPAEQTLELRLRYGRLLKRQGNFKEAIEILGQDSTSKEVDLLISLAKLLEHQKRDFDSAIQITTTALSTLQENSLGMSELQVHNYRSDLTKRLSRLKSKNLKDNGNLNK